MSAELEDGVKLLADYDALAARLAEAERLLMEGAESGLRSKGAGWHEWGARAAQFLRLAAEMDLMAVGHMQDGDERTQGMRSLQNDIDRIDAAIGTADSADEVQK